jgi:MinD-like ATPase involved in chromosome partitioning or flagellar assembly
VPLHLEVRELSDAGKPVVLAAPHSPAAVAYRQIAKAVAERLREELARAEFNEPPLFKSV